MAEVDADVKARVVPIGVVIAAPLAILIHSVYVVIDLAAVIAVTRGVTIDSGAIVFEALITSIVRGGANRSANSQEQAAGQRSGQSNSRPKFRAFHKNLPGRYGRRIVNLLLRPFQISIFRQSSANVCHLKHHWA